MESASVAAGARTQPAETGEKGLKKNAIGFVDGLCIGLASTAPAYSLAAVIGSIVVAVGIHAPGVLLLSFWVLLLNVAAFAAVPAAVRARGVLAPSVAVRVGESGLAVALFAALVALPAAYGATRSAWSESPAGYARLGIVQPGVTPETCRQSMPSSSAGQS